MYSILTVITGRAANFRPYDFCKNFSSFRKYFVEISVISLVLEPNLEGQIPVYIPPRIMVTELCIHALVPLSEPYNGGILIRFHMANSTAIYVAFSAERTLGGIMIEVVDYKLEGRWF
jgi:hypothetical protein